MYNASLIRGWDVLFLGRCILAVALALLFALAREASSAETVYWVDRHSGKIAGLGLSASAVSDALTNPVVAPRDLFLDGVSGKMYWVDGDAFKIQRANFDGTQVEDLVQGTDFSRPGSVVVDAASQKMFWAQGDAVRRADTDGTDVEDLATGLLRPGGLALDAGAGKLYWDDDFGRIQRANLDGSDYEVLVDTGSFTQPPISLDVSGGKMYWSVFSLDGTNKIRRANLDGSSIEDLVSLGTFPTQQMTVDPVGQKIYWSEVLPTAIRRSNLDGSNVEDVVTQNIVLPRSFAVDSAGGKIYWTEEQDHTIRRADLNGANAEDLVSQGLVLPNGIRLDVDDGKMYWTDVGAGAIRRAELTGANVEVVAFRIFRAPAGMAIDRRNEKIYWADRATGLHRVDFEGTSFETLVPGGTNSPHSVALDLGAGKMYWTNGGTDQVRGKIQRSNLDGSGTETLVLSGFTLLVDIALDLGRGKMYWTEGFPSRIRRANLDGSLVEDVLASGTELRGLAIDPLIGKIYFGQSSGSLPGTGFLRRANLDGSDQRTLFSSFPNAITLDLLARKIYWLSSGTEFTLSHLNRANLDGTNGQLLVSQGLGNPHGIAIDLEELPLAGTGLSFDSPSSGFDTFLRITPTAPETQASGRIGSARGVVKDVATDPTTGVLYTIDLTSGPGGLRLRRRSSNGSWTPLPNRTGISAPGFIWGLAFDAQGTLYGGGVGIYTINKHTGAASLLAGTNTTPAFVFGMAASPSGSGFLSTGLLMLPQATLPYVALHAPDGAFVNDAVFVSFDSSGQGRVLFDIAWSKENVLYGIAWPAEAFTSPGGDFHFDLVLVNLTRLEGTPIALWSLGSPLKAVVFGLGEN